MYCNVSVLQRYMVSNDETSEKMFDLISRMLEYEPSQRIQLSKALEHPFFEAIPANQRIPPSK